ncbi:hypothetical protein DTO013E5_2634 [Penicillium roqueforti]|uniref:Genomic scaffold, ProqFM164S02 n=1 Tax=Penicillium roqueforti (strain FM164) TaxID=1365484 RepID=W6Q272_PENRF|nr:uncharacterized protein LCP9604111_8634 [Penicillium roqueforti]CDM30405.1 unnamed protein product [Penicillium roqueforti FM164]KAF9240780.1 hypothetical protein LCP9604111_8634 [Penicillium roqueforti]KAI1838365.1 hypothetical protein CBS147337_90 [Penicillium roqueforti]KAI2680866.1 hypothetical protein CBS147355_3846 [Penicillium roqueforti]KAI2691661.1 hypothetical protein LCP963914a_1862 [Penicillium roqueforti]
MNTATQRTPKTPKPTASVPIVQNKRWPPMANRNALPYKLTHISKEKLAREATAPDPDLRRCVAHFRLHCGSVSWTENDMKSRISSFDFEDTDDEDDMEEINTELPVLKNRAPANDNTVEVTEQLSYKSEPVAIAATPASSTSPASPENPEHGFLEKGRNCLEATSKHLWTGGSCIVSPIAG